LGPWNQSLKLQFIRCCSLAQALSSVKWNSKVILLTTAQKDIELQHMQRKYQSYNYLDICNFIHQNM